MQDYKFEIKVEFKDIDAVKKHMIDNNLTIEEFIEKIIENPTEYLNFTFV
jgi:hypothetical protein